LFIGIREFVLVKQVTDLTDYLDVLCARIREEYPVWIEDAAEKLTEKSRKFTVGQGFEPELYRVQRRIPSNSLVEGLAQTR
jgi:hypothetical protein